METVTRTSDPSFDVLSLIGSIDEENSVDGEDEHTCSSLFSSEEDLADCPICLDTMKEADLRHPLQCSNRCGYNFCRTCIQSLITSSQDDYVEASDGSKQVKIFLHCPNCRSDLSSSIRDTVLLRKAAEVERQKELRDSTRGMKAAMQNVLVKDAIEEARLRETQFFGYRTSSSTESDSSDEDDGAWGFEADLENGVHQSFHCPNRSSRQLEVERILPVDETLLGGLSGIMTEHQKEKITELLTSGDPNQLVEGAELLRCISEEFSPNSPARAMRRSASRRGSVYRLVADAHKAHQKAESTSSAPANLARSRFWRRQMEMELRQRAEYMASHPLPVRVPKSLRLPLKEQGADVLSFVDDVWDGTIDCFNKLTIGFDGCVHMNAQPTHHKGVRNILGYDGPVRIDLDGKSRVVVSSVKGDCGRQGIIKGDVLTHVNDEPWTGTAAELDESLKNEAARDATVLLAFNCGPSVAEALKRRSLVP